MGGCGDGGDIDWELTMLWCSWDIHELKATHQTKSWRAKKDAECWTKIMTMQTQAHADLWTHVWSFDFNIWIKRHKQEWSWVHPHLWMSSLVERDVEEARRHCNTQTTHKLRLRCCLRSRVSKSPLWYKLGCLNLFCHLWRQFPVTPQLMAVYLGGEAGGVQKACAAGKCCFFRAWIRLGRYSGSTHQREPFPLACRTKEMHPVESFNAIAILANLKFFIHMESVLLT